MTTTHVVVVPMSPFQGGHVDDLCMSSNNQYSHNLKYMLLFGSLYAYNSSNRLFIDNQGEQLLQDALQTISPRDDHIRLYRQILGKSKISHHLSHRKTLGPIEHNVRDIVRVATATPSTGTTF